MTTSREDPHPPKGVSRCPIQSRLNDIDDDRYQHHQKSANLLPARDDPFDRFYCRRPDRAEDHGARGSSLISGQQHRIKISRCDLRHGRAFPACCTGTGRSVWIGTSRATAGARDSSPDPFCQKRIRLLKGIGLVMLKAHAWRCATPPPRPHSQVYGACPPPTPPPPRSHELAGGGEMATAGSKKDQKTETKGWSDQRVPPPPDGYS